jgi:hypothetical protein
MIGFMALLVLGAPAPSHVTCRTGTVSACPTPAQEATWSKVVRPYLATHLWEAKVAYDAGHILMVPLHAAFFLADTTWERDLAGQFAAYASRGSEPAVQPADRLGRSQYLYLASEFLVEAARSGRTDLIPAGLESSITAELDQIWNKDDVAAQGHKMSGGLSARLRWKMDDATPGPRYLRAIDDRDRMGFATAADLLVYRRLTNQSGAPGWLKGVVDAAYSIYKARVEWQPDGGWLFQPGWWDGYKDFAFAGTTDVSAAAPAPHPHQPEDASHALRWSVWLRSLSAEAEGIPERKQFYDKMLAGLEIQLFSHVIVPPGDEFHGYRLNNYMDGSNGLYRWTASGAGGHGVGPYGLSGSLTMGWWGFLGTAKSRELYQALAAQFPLADNVQALYGRRDPEEEGGGAVSNSYGNGLRQLLVELAGCLPIAGESH